MTPASFDALIVGGGFYGCTLALHLSRQGKKVALVEKETQVLRHASYANQARVHQGYHYPRALLTARRSHVNYRRFINEYADCVDEKYTAYYAIARTGSKVTAQQFRTFCSRIEAPLAAPSPAVRRLFDPVLVEEVWGVTEALFNAQRLAARLTQALEAAGVVLLLDSLAQRVFSKEDRLHVELESLSQTRSVSAAQVYLCAYAQMNHFLHRSGLVPMALKQEVTEMALVEMPEVLKFIGVTLMCGPFFSFLPFPPTPGLHTLSHVRYTPHTAWQEGPGQPPRAFPERWPATHVVPMLKDAARFIPAIKEARYQRSLWQIKTLLPASETDDSRPILYWRHYGLPGLTCILGGKIDNVYDMVHEVDLA